MNKRSLSVVTSELPDPPYPGNVKAGSFPFEIDWVRIKASKTWRLCPPDLRNSLLRIWTESWNEVPAGSWDDDVEMIAAACDIPVNLLVAHRSVLLRNWVLHSDGRLYHPVVTAMVLSIEETRAKWRKKRASRYNASKNVSGDATETPSGVPLVSRPSSSSSSSSSSSEKETSSLLSGKPDDAPPKKPTDIAEAQDVLEHLNRKARRQYQPVESNLKLIRARLKEHGADRLKAMIDDRVSRWGSNPKMVEYLRPSTLFNASKCADYVGQLGDHAGTGEDWRDNPIYWGAI